MVVRERRRKVEDISDEKVMNRKSERGGKMEGGS